MNIRLCILITVLLLAGFSSGYLSGFAQVKNSTDTISSKKVSLKKIVKDLGWELPKIQDRDLSQTGVVKIQDLPVTLKLYKPEESPLIEINYYGINPDSTLFVNPQTVEARQTISYSYNEKTFCYKTFYVPTSINDGKIVQSGALLTVYYFDEDGDSIFETMHLNSNSVETVPDWVKNPKL